MYSNKQRITQRPKKIGLQAYEKSRKNGHPHEPSVLFSLPHFLRIAQQRALRGSHSSPRRRRQRRDLLGLRNRERALLHFLEHLGRGALDRLRVCDGTRIDPEPAAAWASVLPPDSRSRAARPTDTRRRSAQNIPDLLPARLLRAPHMGRKLRVEVSRATAGRIVQGLGLPRKKTFLEYRRGTGTLSL